MREIWVKIVPFDLELAKTALEGGAAGVWVPEGRSGEVKALGRIRTLSEDGDLVLGESAEVVAITGSDQEAEIAALSREKDVILECPDWTIIPLENLIAQKVDVMPVATSLEEAQTAFGILEVGVRRVMLDISDELELMAALSALQSTRGSVALEEAVVTDVVPLGMGDRVCIDTCTQMVPGQGMLVGNASSALFLVHAETLENPYVAARPFRVNAGAVHAYTRMEGDRTRYLSELSAGDSVTLVDHEGNTHTAIIGRVKIEKRPLMLIRAEAGGRPVSTIVQNAETIRMTIPGGDAISVVALKKGDRILVALEDGARHFGHLISETITEK